jgi:CheY-like chemotaxis protein
MKNQERITIFIIEDNKLFALLLETELKRILTDKYYAIHVFENGELCERFLHMEPQLVIVDYHLDGIDANAMNGLDAIKMIKAKNPDTDFIMVTNDEMTELFLKSKKAGVYDYLTKNSSLIYKLNLLLNQWLKQKAEQQNQNL